MAENRNNILALPSFWFLVLWYLVTSAMWALAFWPVDPASKWLLDAQSVCFGTLENGMPDTYGWIKLICTPLAFLLALYVVWPEEFGDLRKTLFARAPGKVLGVFLIGLVVFQGSWIGQRVAYASAVSSAYKNIGFGAKDQMLPESYPRTFKEAPAFSLVDQEGRSITSESLKGKVVYVTFAFMHCTSICPVLINSVRSALGRSSDEERELVIITLDPWRETPSGLAHVTRNLKLDEREHYLSGEEGPVNELLDQYEIPRARDKKTGDIVHPGLVYVLDREGRIAYTLNSPSARWLVEAGDRAGRTNEAKG